MDILIEKGRSFYKAERYDRALKQFTRAMNSCACNKGMRRQRCHCKDFEAVAEADGSLFNEAMFTCHCDVGKSFEKCDNALHIAALDYRAATFEAMHELERADKDARWMLELAPGLPDSYLRLGKIARLRKDLPFAWKVYRGGIDATKGLLPPSSPKVQLLHRALRPLQLRFSRKDPISLPVEIFHQMLSYLDLDQLTRCIRVSKAWKRTLETGHCRSLWSHLVFIKTPPRPLNKLALRALVDRSGRATRMIVIKDPARFQLTELKLSILLRYSTELQHLELGPARDDTFFFFPQLHGNYQKLRHLSMHTYNYYGCKHRAFADDYEVGSADSFIRTAAETLEYLDLSGIPPTWCKQHDIPDFPRLKVLRLANSTFGHEAHTPLPIFLLARKTPKLEQLKVERHHLDERHPEEWTGLWSSLWTNLKVFVFVEAGDARAAPTTLRAVTLITSLHLGGAFRHLDLHVSRDNRDKEQRVLTDAGDLENLYRLTNADGNPIVRSDQFKNLRSLRLHGFVHCPQRMGNIFGAAVRNGTLQSFDIVFPLEDLHAPRGEACLNHLRGYSWLRGLESIQCFGLSQVDLGCCSESAAGELTDFLATFPNLRVVSLSSHLHDSKEVCFLAEAIMTKTGVTDIYQDCVRGTAMDKLVKLGEQHNVRFMWGDRPREWPMP
ncbi:hypothetical protein CDD83_8720 [Cordyceps sp. RAO-2017]|nr:hypothetical protein CDD83_8720 [Cordyceps sp. RAO-2017]